MSAKAISEATGKDIINRNLDPNTAAAKCRFAPVKEGTSWNELVRNEPWLQSSVSLFYYVGGGGRGVAFEKFHLAFFFPSGSLRRSSTSFYYDGGRGCYSLFAGRSTSYPHEPGPPFIKRLSTSWIVGRGSLLYQNLLICWTKLSIKIITCKLSLYFLSSLLDQECRVSLVLKDLPEWWISFNLETRFPQL